MREVKISVQIFSENGVLTRWQVDFDGEQASGHFEGLQPVVDSESGTLRQEFLTELVQNVL